MRYLTFALGKGRLAKKTMELFEQIGITCEEMKDPDTRKLIFVNEELKLKFFLAKGPDVPTYVEYGAADIGIVGENEYVEKGQEAKLIKRLGFSKCRLSLAIPKDEEYKGAKWFEGKTIATSYPVILRSFLEERGVKADIHVISGSVEIAPGIGLADAIFDIVSSGSTLVSNQLREVEVVLPCEALLIANNNLSKEKLEILDELLFRFEAIQVAEGKKYVLLNAPKEKLDEIIEVLPGMKSPTITPLANDEWVSVQSVIAEKHFWEIIGKLKSLGAEGILVLPIEKMIV